jgi:hypothetical protein
MVLTPLLLLVMQSIRGMMPLLKVTICTKWIHACSQRATCSLILTSTPVLYFTPMTLYKVLAAQNSNELVLEQKGPQGE